MQSFLDADQLIILTSVERVCLNYGTANEQPLDEMTVEEAKQYMDEDSLKKEPCFRRFRQQSITSVILQSVPY